MNYLGIDYGQKYLGVAISSGQLAQGLTTVYYNEALREIPILCEKNNITHILIGQPQGPLFDKVAEFAKSLSDVVTCKVILVDETLTTHEAQKHLASLSRKRQKTKEHQVAAAILLQSYLDAHRPGD
jgi:putative transcription antitermination factor YqgF